MRERDWGVNIIKHLLHNPTCAMICVCPVTQLCLTLCNSQHCSQPGSSVHGILQEEYWSGLHFLLQGIFLSQD